MKYQHYVLTHLKYYFLIGAGILFGIVGIVIMFSGFNLYGISSGLMNFVMIIGFIIILLGVGMVWYGYYKLNELYFHREEGRRVYIQKARWR